MVPAVVARPHARTCLLVGLLLLGCSERVEERPPTEVACRASAPRAPGLWAAGSGTNLALVRAIARRYVAANPRARIVVPESIGTGGALKALRAQAIDLGLASRALTDEERREGFVEVPLARVAYAPTVRAELGLRSISSADLAALFAGRAPAGWPADVPLVPVLREAKDSGSLLVDARLPDVGRAIAVARASERWLTRYSDQEMRDSLLALDGAVGFLDVATARLEHLPLTALAIDGVEPTADNVREGRYPLVRRLSFVTRGKPSAETERFIAFARSEEVADLFEAGGLVREGVAEGDR